MEEIVKQPTRKYKLVKWFDKTTGIIVETFGKKPAFAYIAKWENGPTFSKSNWVKIDDVSIEDIRDWER